MTCWSTLCSIVSGVTNHITPIFFIGAEDEKDTPGKATRRFQFYSDFTLSVVSNRIFRHFRNDHLSLYILINKEHVADVESLKNRITHYVAKAMAEE